MNNRNCEIFLIIMRLMWKQKQAGKFVNNLELSDVKLFFKFKDLPKSLPLLVQYK